MEAINNQNINEQKWSLINGAFYCTYRNLNKMKFSRTNEKVWNLKQNQSKRHQANSNEHSHNFELKKLRWVGWKQKMVWGRWRIKRVSFLNFQQMFKWFRLIYVMLAFRMVFSNLAKKKVDRTFFLITVIEWLNWIFGNGKFEMLIYIVSRTSREKKSNWTELCKLEFEQKKSQKLKLRCRKKC